MTNLARATGFDGIPFQILMDQGEMPDWERELITVSQKIPSSNTTITQIDGYGDWEMECRLLFASERDWQAFDARRGRRGQLIHLRHMTSAPVPVERYILGDVYAIFDDVLYHGPASDYRRRLRDGRVIVRVRFSRPSTEDYDAMLEGSA